MAVPTLIYDAYRDYSSKRSELLSDPIFNGEGVPKGRRDAILLIPGFSSGDWTFSTMSRWLRQIGYRTHLSGININVGCPQRKVERMLGRLEEISKDAGGRIAIIGHSLGGLVACALARQRPDLSAMSSRLVRHCAMDGRLSPRKYGRRCSRFIHFFRSSSRRRRAAERNDVPATFLKNLADPSCRAAFASLRSILATTG